MIYNWISEDQDQSWASSLSKLLIQSFALPIYHFPFFQIFICMEYDLISIFTPPKPFLRKDHSRQFFYGLSSPQPSLQKTVFTTYELPRKYKTEAQTQFIKQWEQGYRTLVNQNAVFDRNFHKYRKRAQEFSNIFFNYRPQTQQKKINVVVEQQTKRANNKPQTVQQIKAKPVSSKQMKSEKKIQSQISKKTRSRASRKILELQIFNNLQKVKKNPAYYLGYDVKIIQIKRGERNLLLKIQSLNSADKVIEYLGRRGIEALEVQRQLV